MKLSNLKPGDKFRLWSMPNTVFSFINPRFGLFIAGEKVKYTYISTSSHQLYGSMYDYEVVPYQEETVKIPFTLTEEGC